MGIRFKVKHYPDADAAHKFRYAIKHSNGQEMLDGEGYPTYQHTVRAIRGLMKGMARLLGFTPTSMSRDLAETNDVAIPFTADSYKPKAK